MKHRISALVIGAGILLVTSTVDAVGRPALVGKPHPGFPLPSVIDRRPISLSQFRGRKVLRIHFASW